MCNERLHQTQSRELMNMKLNQLPGSTTVILHCAWNFTEILSTLLTALKVWSFIIKLGMDPFI